MKILNIKIRNNDGKIVRDINFSEEGITFIYGDILDPKNKKATINSLGKTLLIKFIDYIYGANEDSSIVKEVLFDYSLEASVKYRNHKYLVVRKLGNSDNITINNETKTLSEYKEFFRIKRSRVSRQILVSKKMNNIGYRKSPNKDDVMDFIYFLGLDKIIDSIEMIYMSQNQIKKYKESKLELIKFYGDIDVKEIDEEIFFIDKEVERLTAELDNISNKIKKIQISEMQVNIIEEFSEKSQLLKKLTRDAENLQIEKKRIEVFLENSNKIDVTSDHILMIYEKAKQEVPDIVKRKVNEVELFHKKVYEERKEFLGSKIAGLTNNISSIKADVRILSVEVNKLGEIISLNEVYEESIGLYEKYSKDLQELKFKEGKLSQIKTLDDEIDEEDTNLTTEFENASKLIKDYHNRVEDFRNFIYEITKAIYDNDVNSFFDIKIRKKHQRNRPVTIDLTLRGDTGEGVSEVKKNIIDYLLFEFSGKSEVLVQDSSCYNGIDPRQVSGMISEVSKMADQNKKQVIIAVNKYQLGEYSDIVDYVIENSAIILSENDKLMKFDF